MVTKFQELQEHLTVRISQIRGVPEHELPATITALLQHTIQHIYSPKLQRIINTPEAALRAAEDSKMPGQASVYIPASDDIGFNIWFDFAKALPAQILNVKKIDIPLDDKTADEMSKSAGFLSLAHEQNADGNHILLPYVVPGGRFNEIYGWDTNFIAMGLLIEGNVTLVRSLIKHHLAEIQMYGRVLNANRCYYLTRSQPPLFIDLVLSYADHLSAEEFVREKALIESCIKAGIQEYEAMWTAEPHQTKNGLSRYFDPRKHFPPETEPGHFDPVIKPYADKLGISIEAYMQAFNAGEIENSELADFVMHDGAVRESGHDTTNALIGKAAHLNVVCLNSFLGKAEADIACLIESYFGGSLHIKNRITTAEEWRKKFEHRKQLMDQFLWNEKCGYFEDYDFIKGAFSAYISPRGLFPLWAGLASQQQADRIVSTLLPALEFPGGLASSDESSRGPVTLEHPQRQWDYPAGWAPHQILAWKGLERYGYHEEAQRLIYKWLFMITTTWLHTRTIVEKYDVVTSSQDFHAEYGNVGQGMDLHESAGFGWTNASYEIGLARLDSSYRDKLDRLISPDVVFDRSKNRDFY
ncbi:MAG: trehalase family glycosidase [Pseudomonadota bacterium]